MRNVFKFCMIFMLFGVGCKPAEKKPISDNKTVRTTKVKYARGFIIEHYDYYTKVTVRNPWDTTQTLETYILVPRTNKMYKKLPAGQVVKVPVKRVGLCTSIFAGQYALLGTLDKVVAVSEPQYFDIPEIQARIKNNTIIDLGITATLNTEKVLTSKLDILVISPFELSVNDRFASNGICVVKDASYMENSPLGRTEWIKFEAAFLNKSDKADSLFAAVEKRYISRCKLIPKTAKRPTVFDDKKFGNSWYIAGAKSYIGQFYKDAGARYIFDDLNISGSVSLSFEKVYQRAVNADFWLFNYNNVQSDMTLDELKRDYELYAKFAAYKNKKVYAVNSRKTPYYEKGALEPDVVLSDMIAIFHPELMPDYKPQYYNQLP
ncbi:MAG: hypothetical protein AUK44_10295 [Porphyromonadaceae bacterium CG2_30_38_12]|nr:MAG: hypothetical protein AUK44_10295 [Porphyromonadaceae bacterium CG2_30_38_12]